MTHGSPNAAEEVACQSLQRMAGPHVSGGGDDSNLILSDCGFAAGCALARSNRAGWVTLHDESESLSPETQGTPRLGPSVRPASRA